jgi:hypothetical protein
MKAILDTDICIYIIKRGAMDMLIAAHALSLSASLVTNNETDFRAAFVPRSAAMVKILYASHSNALFLACSPRYGSAYGPRVGMKRKGSFGLIGKEPLVQSISQRGLTIHG